MQNKPNLLNTQMNTTKVLTKDYENERLCRGFKNKANQTQSCPPTCPPEVYQRRKHQRRRIQNGQLCYSQLSADGAGQLGDDISFETVDRLVRQCSIGVSKPERKRNALFVWRDNSSPVYPDKTGLFQFSGGFSVHGLDNISPTNPLINN